VVVAALLALAGCTSVPPGEDRVMSPATSASPSASSPLAALTVGTCTDAVTDGDEPAGTITTTSCSQPHAWEVASVVPLTGADYPGEDELRTLAAAGCTRAFTAYVGVDVASSPYDVTFVAPSESHWSNPDAREIVCLVGTAVGGLSTSLKNHPVVFAEKGQCLGAPAKGSTSYRLVSCASAHLYEVYATAKVAGDKRPAQAELDKLYTKVCVAGFTKFVGIKPAKSKYEIQYSVLPEELWTKFSDHRLVCSAGSPSGGITGSLKGAGK